jgi:hypothetical protein
MWGDPEVRLSCLVCVCVGAVCDILVLVLIIVYFYSSIHE